MVVLIRDLGNKFFISSTNTHSQQNVNSLIPTVSSVNITGMDSSTGQAPVFNFEVRGRIPTSTVNFSREPSIAFSGHSTPYHDRMDTNMDCSSTMGEPTAELSYKTEQEKALWVSMAADLQEPMRPKGGNIETLSTHAPHEKSIINIQLPYDTQAPIKPELWSGSFHPISLYGSIERFASDTKSIKTTLDFLAKYIKNKQVNSSMVNDLTDFDGMGDAIWNFISSVYEAK